MLGEFVSHAHQYGENAIGLMVRRERTQLLETIERSKQLYGPLGWKFHEQASLWRAPNGARLRFAHLERDSDADAYQGHSYSRVYIEEAGTFPSEAPILKLMATLRSGAGVPVGIRLTGNPGGPGQHWVKTRYIDPCPQGWEVQYRTFTDPFSGEKVERDWVYIPSKVTDNHYLGSDYIANLQMVGSPELVRAWLEGDWTVIEGAFFSEFNYARHVLKPFEIPEHWTRIRACDWGSYRPFSVGWYAVSDGTIGGIPKGAMIKYREWYGMRENQPNVGLKLTAEEVRDGIVSRETKGEKINDSVIDPSAFTQDGGPSIAERMLPDIQWRPADNKRVAKSGALGGWDQLRGRLKGNEDGALLYFFETCTHTIRTLPALQHDKQRPEDLDTEAEDHCFAGDTEILIDGEQVFSLGKWRDYRNARITRRNALLYRVHFSDGSAIKCTPDHRFWTTSGWVEARHLSQKALPLSLPQGRISEDCVTTFADLISCGLGEGKESGTRNDYIEPSGYTIMARFQRAIISIMSMATGPIIDWTTLNWYKRPSTSPAIPKSESTTASFTSATGPDKRPQNGMAAKQVSNGTESNSENTAHQLLLNVWTRVARSAVSLIRQARYMLAARNSVAENAKQLRCVGVEEYGHDDVYCLTVPSIGAFTLANGLTVSNCADETRYAVMSRPITHFEQKPEQARFPVERTINELVEAQKRKRLAMEDD